MLWIWQRADLEGPGQDTEPGGAACPADVAPNTPASQSPFLPSALGQRSLIVEEFGLRLSLHLPPGAFHFFTLHSDLFKGSFSVVLGSFCPQRWAQAGGPPPGPAILSLCTAPGPLSISREKLGSAWHCGEAWFYNIC